MPAPPETAWIFRPNRPEIMAVPRTSCRCIDPCCAMLDQVSSCGFGVRQPNTQEADAASVIHTMLCRLEPIDPALGSSAATWLDNRVPDRLFVMPGCLGKSSE